MKSAIFGIILMAIILGVLYYATLEETPKQAAPDFSAPASNLSNLRAN